jgi:hypothetical protein
MSTANLDSADLKAATYKGLIREDVMNRIFDISRIPLPFTDMIGTDTHTNEYTEWTLDVLATPNTANAVVDGSDASGNNTVIGNRVGNHSQISTKVVRVSFRADASDVIGRTKETSYQVMRRQQELRRDVDAICLLNQASVSDDGNTTAGKVGGLPSWLGSHNYGGTAGGFSTTTGLTVARTPTAARALTETLVRDAVQAVYQDGGDPTVMMSIPGIIRKFSEYLFTSSARVATLMSDQGKSSEKATALGSVNVFVTDFGTLKLVPNRLQPTHTDSGSTTVADVFILDPSYLSLSYLKGYRTEDLARTGLAENKMMSVDWTLKVLTEKSMAIIGDINPASAVTL